MYVKHFKRDQDYRTLCVRFSHSRYPGLREGKVSQQQRQVDRSSLAEISGWDEAPPAVSQDP